MESGLPLPPTQFPPGNTRLRATQSSATLGESGRRGAECLHAV